MKLFPRSTVLLFLLIIGIISCNQKDTSTQKEPKSNETMMDKAPSVHVEKSTVLFFGNSLTAGYGLDKDESFPSLMQDTLDQLNLKYNVINAGLSGETTSGGVQRIDWVLNQNVDYFVLELGANDMLRGLPIEETEKNLRIILQKVKEKYPVAKMAVCQMMAAPNMGKDYAIKFEAVFPKLAKEFNITLIPFFLEGVAGNADLLLQDGKHPNAKGQKIVAKNIFKSLKHWF